VQVGGYDPVEYKGTSDVSGDFYRNQFGLVAGIAAEMNIKTYPVSIEFRYHYNLNPVNRPDTSTKYYLKNTTEVWGDNLKIATLSLSVAVTLTYF
jgi:hypothetical protein